MKTTSKLIIFIFTFLALVAGAYAQTPREELQQMVEQLQKTPNDNALREKIITLATSIKPALAIPEEANRAFVKGNVFQKEAKDASGYELAISAYREALRSAPWWGDAYFNLAVALEAADKFDEAIASVRNYMALVSAGSTEAREAQNRIYAIEAKSEMASRQAVVKQEKANSQRVEQQAQERFFKNLDGGIWIQTPAGDTTFDDFFEIRGREIESYSVLKPGNSTARLNPDSVNRRFGSSWKMTFDRREFLLSQELLRKVYGNDSIVTEAKVTISEDGQTITLERLRLGRPVLSFYRRI